MLTTVQNGLCLFTSSLIYLRLENLSAICTPDAIVENLDHEYDNEIFLSCLLTLSNIPTWSALKVTKIATPPLVAPPAHEFQTLRAVLKQAQGINAKAMGAYKKTVISLDLGLYKSAKHLQMYRNGLHFNQ